MGRGVVAGLLAQALGCAAAGSLATAPVADGRDDARPSIVAPSSEPDAPRPPDAASAPATVAGAWVGTYVRTVQAGGSESTVVVAFTLEIQVDERRIRGRMVERDAPDVDEEEVVAVVDGSVAEDGVIRFSTRLETSTGRWAIAEYVGRLDAVTDKIEGTWSAQGASGRFMMRRDRPQPQLAHATVPATRA